MTKKKDGSFTPRGNESIDPPQSAGDKKPPETDLDVKKDFTRTQSGAYATVTATGGINSCYDLDD